MFDFDNENDVIAYEELKKAAVTMSGINFALAMREDDGSITIHERENQPCQGGEMRKYKRTHGDTCTRPKDNRPGDLTKPFPKTGTPIGVAVHFMPKYSFTPTLGWNTFIRAAYGANSPYRVGFGSPEDVEFIPGDNGLYKGVIFKNTKIDPTVFVNSLQYANSMKGIHEMFDVYIKAGMTETEALVTMMLMSSDPRTGMCPPTGTYYFSASPSIRRLFEGKPHDLSGGTFYDRYDYNRPQVQDLFRAGKGEHKVSFNEALLAKGLVHQEKTQRTYGGRVYDDWRSVPVDLDFFVRIVKEVFAEAIEAAKDEDYSIVTLQNKNFWLDTPVIELEDEEDDEGYGASYDEDDYEELPYDDDDEEEETNPETLSMAKANGLVVGEWVTGVKTGAFQVGCTCGDCKSNFNKYVAAQKAKETLFPTPITDIVTAKLSELEASKKDTVKIAKVPPFVTAMKAAPAAPKKMGKKVA